MGVAGYEIIEEDKSENGIQYLFVSIGRTIIVKAVQYGYIMDLNGMRIYNMGFGDYNIDNDYIDDSTLTDNGDTYKVFNTALGTIPKFFSQFPETMMLVRGSDSSTKFMDSCRMTCSRKCGTYCKKANRRINVYREYVNKNFSELNKEYKFYGGMINTDNFLDIEDYVVLKNYDAVLVVRNNM